MSSRSKSLPVRILESWFDVVLVIGGAATILFLGRLAFSPSWMAGGERPSDATVQAVVGERSWPLYFTSLAEILAGSLIVVSVIWLVRKVLVNVLDERPFAALNGTYLQRSGHLVLPLGAVWPILKTNKARAIQFSTLECLRREPDCQPGDLLEYSERE